MTKKIISIVISAYNEEGNINELYKQLLQNTKEKDLSLIHISEPTRPY